VERTFDFLVIGAQKCGTTSLWRGMDSHPEILTPSDKERRFFEVDEHYQRGVDAYIDSAFGDPRADQRLGIVSSQLMPPRVESRLKVIDRIAETCPEVKLVALLRDPIDRAASFFRFAERRSGRGGTDFGAFFERALRKHGGLESIPFVAAGCYGAILESYAARFGRERLLVLFTEELEFRPEFLYSELFEFLGVDPGHTVDGSMRLNVGGMHERISEAAMLELRTELQERVWPHVGDRNVRIGFNWWLRQVWNIEPDAEPVTIPQAVREQLAELYLPDAELLEQRLSVRAPWVKRISEERSGGSRPIASPG